jgi:hypothetical protein
MPKYDVVVTRKLEISTTITVQAKTEEEAEEKAMEQISDSILAWNVEDRRDWTEDSDDCRVDQIDPH